MPDEVGHTDRGKWSQAGVPKKGWVCVGVEDLGEPSQLCEMCESIEIRYAHYMEHPEYPDGLTVGCVCAEHLEEDYVGPREREHRLKNAASRRKTWMKRVWRVSARGNSYINADGFNIAVAPNASQWQLRVTNRASGATRWGRKGYATEDAAKLAALDALIWAKERL